jgi:hypothetical protein
MRKILVFFFIPIFLVACTPAGTETPTTPPASEQPTDIPTTPPVQDTPLAIAVIPMEVAQDQADLYQTTVYNLTQEHGYRFQTRSTLTEVDVQNEPGLEIVVAFPPDLGVTSLATAAPDVQFLAVNIPGLTAGGNLSVIGGDEQMTLQQAFAAGYMAATLSLDYRVGIITEESNTGLLTIEAFTNGRAYYCGLCQASFPPWPPAYQYPVHPQIPLNTPLSQYSAYSDYLFDRLVEVTYVDPLVATPELLDYMALYDMLLIGEYMPFEDLQPNWVASIQPDITPAIQSLWSDLVVGLGGQKVPIPLMLTDINPDLLGGKQRLVEEVLAGLQSGLIDTGVIP